MVQAASEGFRQRDLQRAFLEPGYYQTQVSAFLPRTNDVVSVQKIGGVPVGDAYRQGADQLASRFATNAPLDRLLYSAIKVIGYAEGAFADALLPVSDPGYIVTRRDGTRTYHMGEGPTTAGLAGQIPFPGKPILAATRPAGQLGFGSAAQQASRNSLNVLNQEFTPSGTRVLQNLANRENALLSTNLARALEVLEPAEVAAAAAHRGVAIMQYGNAVERLVAREIARDPQGLGTLFEHNLTGRGPDFFGRGLLQGQIYDITTPGQVPAHLARPYGQGLNTIINQRPAGFP